jgi:DnaJ-class molecular chaperone
MKKTKQEIINGYKAMAKIHHPDAGGSIKQFQKIRKAYDEAIK